jgi:hypothetical protein
MVLIRYEVVPPEDTENNVKALLQMFDQVDVERTFIITSSDEDTCMLVQRLENDDHSVSVMTNKIVCDPNASSYFKCLSDFRSGNTRVLIMSYACYCVVRNQGDLSDIVVSHDCLVSFDIDINIARNVQETIRHLHCRGHLPTTPTYKMLNLIY